METKYSELIKLYDELYNQTYHISELLAFEDNAEDVKNAVLKRGLLMSSMDEIILSSTFTDEEKASLNICVKKVKVIELKAMSLMEEKHAQFKKETDQNRINAKMASAYRLKEYQAPVIFDERE